MANASTNAATLESYAQALLELADARGSVDQTAEDVAGIAQVIENDATFAQYVSDPSVGDTQRDALIDRVFAGRTSDLLVAYLKLVNAKGRLGDFPGIARAFKALLDERAGNITVDVTVAQALSPDALEGVRQQLSGKLNKNVSVNQKVDDSIIGGVILKIGDSLIDGSVKAQLEAMKRRLMAAV
jgi:F-type H+-transporting ATPase subunit delta